MKYLKKFENHSQYESYIATDYAKPNVSYCVTEGDVHYNPIVHDYTQDLFTFEALEDCVFTYNRGYEEIIGLGDVYSSAAYSLDSGQTWTWFTYNESSAEDRDTTPKTTPVIRAGETIAWKFEHWDAIGGDYCLNVGSFSSSGRFKVYGNLYEELYDDYYDIYNSATGIFRNCDKLVDAENLILCVGDTQHIDCSGLFYGCTSLVKAPKLPATTLDNNSSYASMFYGCTSLTTAPELPAETLTSGCYANMFYGCTSLTSAPELTATTLTDSCYNTMFGGCTSLTTAPELPATTLAQSCYSSMFRDCTSLVTAPELPATTLADYCYNSIFQGCTSLTTAPELPATTLVAYCYNSMFYGCTSLTTAPELLAETLVNQCYNYMFYDCSNLNYIKAMFRTTPSGGDNKADYGLTKSWVSGVSASGTFVKNSAAQWNVSGINGIPNGWTVQTASE